ncbi:MAG: RsmE family RNA methyltransferase [Clostridia bacterium]
MEIKRFFANKEDFFDDKVNLHGDEFYHLTKVLRYKVGFNAIVCCGDDLDYYCKVEKIEKDSAVLKITKKEANNCKTKHYITLFQALPKGDKMDLIVQKAVELGVSEIVFFNSKNVAETKFNLSRLQKICVEACKQCGRSFVPVTQGLLTFKQCAENLKTYDTQIVCYEDEKRLTLSQILKKAGARVAVVIGSEGGFCPEEVEILKINGAFSVTLGKRILRCETASITALAIAMNDLGEMQ